MLGFNSSEDIPEFAINDISEINMRCDICIRELWHYMYKTIELLKELHFLVRALNKLDICPREEIFGFCKKIITKLTDYFFTIINLGTESFGSGY